MALKRKKITAEDACGISVKIIKENKDGSADAEVKFNKQGLETLVQWGLVSILACAIDEYRPRPDKGGTPVIKRIKKPTKKGAK